MALTKIEQAGIADDAVDIAQIKAATDGVIITYDASGNPVHVGPGTDGQVLTSTGAGSPPAFEDAATSVGGATGIDFNDNVKVRFGTGNDSEIYHDGSNLYIKETTGTGDIYLESDDIYLRNNGGTATIAGFKSGGTVELYYNGNKKFETTSDGWKCADSVKGVFGAGNDLQIYHDGSHSYIQDAGSGSLIFVGSGITFQNAAQSENMLTVTENASVDLYYDNSKKLETASYGIGFPENVRITTDDYSLQIGADQDLRLFHSSNASEIQDFAAQLNIRSDSLDLISKTGGEPYVKCQLNGGVELYYDNTLTCYTSNTCLSFPDDQKIFMGGGNDLQIYHSTQNWIKSGVDGTTLHIDHDITQIRNHGGTEVMAKFTENAAVELYYDNAKKLETYANGVIVSNRLAWDADNYLTCNTSANTIEIVTDGSQVAEWYATGLKFLDSQYARFGNGNDFNIYHDGNNTKLINATGRIDIETGTGDIALLGKDGTESMAKFIPDGAVELYHNNVKILETTSVGVDLFEVYGNTVGGSIRDLYIRNDGRLGYDSSVRASKTNIADLTDVAWLDDLKPKTFNKKKQDDTGAFTSENYTELEYGLIAEDVETVNKELCSYSTSNVLEAVHYKKLITPMLKALQDARSEITILKTKVAALEAK